MHYHIFWGLRTADEPFIINLFDKDEAIDKFISLIKDVEGNVDDAPPPWDEKEYDENTYVVRVQSEKYKYLLVYCKNKCDAKNHPNPLQVN